jgi:hypothetical protein
MSKHILAEDGSELDIQVAADKERDVIVVRLSKPVEVFTIEYGTSIGLAVLLSRKVDELASRRKAEIQRIQREIRMKMKLFWKELILFSWGYYCRLLKFWV